MTLISFPTPPPVAVTGERRELIALVLGLPDDVVPLALGLSRWCRSLKSAAAKGPC